MNKFTNNNQLGLNGQLKYSMKIDKLLKIHKVYKDFGRFSLKINQLITSGENNSQHK